MCSYLFQLLSSFDRDPFLCFEDLFENECIFLGFFGNIYVAICFKFEVVLTETHFCVLRIFLSMNAGRGLISELSDPRVHTESR